MIKLPKHCSLSTVVVITRFLVLLVSREASLIDLSLFREVTLSEDKSSVIIGTGAKWMDVSKSLEEKGVAVVGGRNSQVGVGGLALGGQLSLL